MAKHCSCSIEIGATAGVMVIVMAIITIIAATIFLWWRWVRERQREVFMSIQCHASLLPCNFSCRKKAFAAKDVAISVNVAYEDLAEYSKEPKTEQYYENLNDIMKSSRQQPDNEAVAACSATDPNASEHISMEETM